VVAAVSEFLFRQGANLVDSNQHTTDPAAGEFFLRVEFDLPELASRLTKLEQDFAALAQKFAMEFRFAIEERRKNIAVFVSKQDHCLVELLWQWKAGDLKANIAKVVSNHPDLAAQVAPYGVPFHHVPVTPETKGQDEARAIELLGQDTDLVVLARYMQIVTPAFIARYPSRMINIHHSFLPAFVGANPYAKAYERGVKLIGATAHYVTAELDAGPIIEQDVHRVGHRDEVEDLKRIGRQVERAVLARAVRWHLEDRVLVHGNKTVVFA
jgi:formyltetrahydrofolate deformylase